MDSTSLERIIAWEYIHLRVVKDFILKRINETSDDMKADKIGIRRRLEHLKWLSSIPKTKLKKITKLENECLRLKAFSVLDLEDYLSSNEPQIEEDTSSGSVDAIAEKK